MTVLDKIEALASEIGLLIKNNSNNTSTNTNTNSYTTYTTDETEIGIWIDNKKLYRKIILSTLHEYSVEDEPQSKVHGTIANVDKVISLESFIEVSDADGGGLPGNVFIDTGNNFYASSSKDNENNLTIESVQAGELFDSAPVRFTVTYTKVDPVENNTEDE